MKTSHIEKIPDSCLPSDEILAQLGFEKADNPTRPPEQHSPLPWRLAAHDSLKGVYHIDAGPQGYERTTVAIVNQNKSSKANAAYIVKAANEYPKLVADRDLWQTKAENWERLATTKLQVVKDLAAQRDELLAALERVLDVITGDQAAELGVYAAIAKCEAQP